MVFTECVRNYMNYRLVHVTNITLSYELLENMRGVLLRLVLDCACYVV